VEVSVGEEADKTGSKTTAGAPRTQAGNPQLESLMASGPAAPRRDLDAEAIAAAQAAIAGAEQALHGAQEALGAPPRRRLGVRERVLRGLLALNLLLMAILLILPEHRAGKPPPASFGEPPVETRTAPASPFVQPWRERVPVIPDQDVYNEALRLADVGQYAAAAAALQRYLEAHHNLAPLLKMNLYGALSRYLFQAHDLEGAQRYALMAAQLQRRALLPDDLIATARLAEKQGNTEEMRRAYARFLLLQRQIRPDLRQHLAEAYLKLGDSYRLESELHEQQAERETQRKAQQQRDAATGRESQERGR
jgi:TolA-binding protein